MDDAEDLEFSKRIRKYLEVTTEDVDELREKLTGWGFSPALDKCVKNLITESGYWVLSSGKDGKQTAEVRPKKGSFDLARAREAVGDLEFCIRSGRIMVSQENVEENSDVLALATRLCLAATKSLEEQPANARFRRGLQAVFALRSPVTQHLIRDHSPGPSLVNPPICIQVRLGT